TSIILKQQNAAVSPFLLVYPDVSNLVTSSGTYESSRGRKRAEPFRLQAPSHRFQYFANSSPTVCAFLRSINVRSLDTSIGIVPCARTNMIKQEQNKNAQNTSSLYTSMPTVADPYPAISCKCSKILCC